MGNNLLYNHNSSANRIVLERFKDAPLTHTLRLLWKATSCMAKTAVVVNHVQTRLAFRQGNIIVALTGLCWNVSEMHH
ncbi:MAG: hypothetical protein M1135_03650 [Candidatus Omnitrophica bacterium]|nr:hypothetical protein [Candidatus Omnitrophota bacterium]